MKTYTMADIRAANAAAGLNFFSADTMSFFKSRVESVAYNSETAAYFVTSEKYNDKAPRLFTVRKFNPGDATMSTVGDFQQYADLDDARQVAMECATETDEEPTEPENDTLRAWIMFHHGENLSDIAAHGANSGYEGLTYTRDLVKLHDDHSAEIWDALTEEAKDFGAGTALAHVASFNGAESVDDDESLKTLLVNWYVEKIAAENDR